MAHDEPTGATLVRGSLRAALVGAVLSLAFVGLGHQGERALFGLLLGCAALPPAFFEKRFARVERSLAARVGATALVAGLAFAYAALAFLQAVYTEALVDDGTLEAGLQGVADEVARQLDAVPRGLRRWPLL